MKFQVLGKSITARRLAASAARTLRPAVAMMLSSGLLLAQSVTITNSNWGAVTTPVYGSSDPNPNYSAAEIQAGPNKLGSYYAGVLPNGKKVTPAGTSIQIGMNPLGMAITPDGQFIVTSNDDEREGGDASFQSTTNMGGYTLSVVATSTMSVVSQFHSSARYFVGMAATGPAGGPYTVYVSGGPDNDVKLFSLSNTGVLAPGTPASIRIFPVTPSTSGFVSNYVPGTQLNTPDASGNLPPAPSQINRTAGAQLTYPAGIALSPDGHYVYVACNADNSVAVIDTRVKGIVSQVPVGYFPYTVAVRSDGQKILVSNWGQMAYKFKNPTYDANGRLIALGGTGNLPDGFYIPPTSHGANPLSSSVSRLTAPQGFGSLLSYNNAYSFGDTPDINIKVGGTHPSAMAIVKSSTAEVAFITLSNSDTLARVNLTNGATLPKIDLNPIAVSLSDHRHPKGTYPNALAVSPDQTRLYVAEAGLNSVAVFDTTDPINPSLLGRIPTGWYPTALSISQDGHFLYIANAKGVGEDINPAIDITQPAAPTGMASDSRVDSNYIFGSLQQVDLTSYVVDNTTVLNNDLAINQPTDISVVPVGSVASQRIKHVFFIMHENKTFDSMLGNLGGQFGLFAGTTFNNIDGSTYTNGQFTGVSLNTQALASAFATGVNYYSDSEESDAGHQFAMSGTATDYTEKTLLVKGGRGMLVNKNFEPEDYPYNGYIFNNAARNQVSFKDYAGFARVQGTDTGSSTPTTLNDSTSGNVGYPTLQADNFTITSNPLVNAGDTTTPVGGGLGQSYFQAQPILAILGTNNPASKGGEPRMDLNYPGYNFNISDQRRATEFISDFDRMVTAGTLPQYIFLYQPNDHTGGVQAPNQATVCGGPCGPLQQVADGDVGLGMVVQHIMNSPVYYDAVHNTGSAIFVSYDDAQSTRDHIHPHRTPVVVVSPFAKPGYMGLKHYSTASIVKTEELLLGLPPNNLGDLFATDMRDMFQPTYNGITAASITFNVAPPGGRMSEEGAKIWSLVSHLDTSAPDRDSRRLGGLTRLVMQADQLRETATKNRMLNTSAYTKQQKDLYDEAVKLVNTGAAADSDD